MEQALRGSHPVRASPQEFHFCGVSPLFFPQRKYALAKNVTSTKLNVCKEPSNSAKITKQVVEKHGLKTKYRIIPECDGIYQVGKKKERITETEKTSLLPFASKLC